MQETMYVFYGIYCIKRISFYLQSSESLNTGKRMGE